jgi:hypothetical protein
MTEPSVADSESALEAFRLGWAMAEVRGRTWLGDRDPAAAAVPDATRVGHALPLAAERKPGEQAIESREVLATLAARVGVDVPANRLTGQRGYTSPASARLRSLSDAVDSRRGSQREFRASWNAFSRFVYAWDAHIQDVLAAGAFGRASAYQLGRGLAEASWALDPPSDPGSWSGWSFLLGTERVAFLQQLLDRLAPYFHPLTLPALKNSLEQWRMRAAIEAGQAPAQRERSAAPQALRQQARRWRDLVVTRQDPRIPLEPGAKIRKSAVVWPYLRSLWPQLSFVALGTAVLVVAAYLVPSNGSQGAVAAILGTASITSATISAKAKSSAQSLLAQARAAFDIAVAVQATCILPPEQAAHGRR